VPGHGRAAARKLAAMMAAAVKKAGRAA
jgi:hypothetical protein